jgi:hypothetical protein
VQGEFDGCVEVNGDCQPFSVFQQPAPEIPSANLGLKDQADAYASMLSAINQRSWVAGFFASGYFPPVELRDLSISVRNKPAGDVLWYWYPRLLGQIKP